MTIIRGFLRGTDSALPVAAGTDVEIRKIDDDTLLDTVTTDADGIFEYQVDGNPGPVYWTATVGATTKTVRSDLVMPVGPIDMSALRHAFGTWSTGVILSYPNSNGSNRLRVTANGSDMDVTVNTGAAIARGIIHDQSAQKTITIATAPDVGSRTDAIFIRFYYSGARAGETIIHCNTIGSMQPDTNHDAGYIDMPLAYVTVDAGVTAIATNKVQDKRPFATPQSIPSPSVVNINKYLAGKVTGSNTSETLIDTSETLPDGKWSGTLTFRLEAYVTSGVDYCWITATAGGTSGSSYSVPVRDQASPLEYVIQFTDVSSGSKALKLDLKSAEAGIKFANNIRISGTLIKTGN